MDAFAGLGSVQHGLCIGDGVNLKATEVSGDLFRPLASSIDLTGDATYYLAARFRATGTDQY